MAKQININSNSNKVNIEDINSKIIVRDDNKNTTVNVESQTTKIVQVNTPGPKGTKGEKGDTGPSGSMDGVVVTDNSDNEKKKIIFVIDQPGGSGTTGSLGVDSNLEAFSFNPSDEVLYSSNISSSGFVKGYNITGSNNISASGNIYGSNLILSASGEIAPSVNHGTIKFMTKPPGSVNNGETITIGQDLIEFKLSPLQTTLKSYLKLQPINGGQNLISFNDDSQDIDFIIKGTSQVAFKLDAANDMMAFRNYVGIGDSANKWPTSDYSLTGTPDKQLMVQGLTHLTGSVEIIGHTTASGDITASGAFFFSSSLNSNASFKSLVYDTSTGKVFHTGSYGGGGGGGGVGFPYSGSDAQFGTPPQAIITGSLLLSGSGHITSSGNISASFTSTGSFGRLLSHTIGGLSPVSITDDTQITGSLVLSGSGHITASGNISSSGTIYGGEYWINNNRFVTGSLYPGTLQIGDTDHNETRILITDSANKVEVRGADPDIISFYVDGTISASQNIIATQNIIGGQLTSSVGVLITSSTSTISQNPLLIKFDDANGQPEKFSVSSSGVVRFGALNNLPSPITGGLVYSASNFYFGV